MTVPSDAATATPASVPPSPPPPSLLFTGVRGVDGVLGCDVAIGASGSDVMSALAANVGSMIEFLGTQIFLVSE